MRRIGMLLGVSRTRRGLSLGVVARRLDWNVGPTILDQIEKGRYRFPVEAVPVLAHAYGVDLDDILPSRDALVVELRRGRLRVGRRRVRVGRNAGVDELLHAYVALVRMLRGLGPDGSIDPRSLRLDDIVELALAADEEPAEVENRLVALVRSHDEAPGPDVGAGQAALPLS